MRLTIKTVSSAGLLVYILIRVLSFFTYFHPLINQVIAGICTALFVYVCLKNLRLGWFILVGELMIDGAGHFFELHSLLVRTWFLGIFCLLWLMAKIKQKKIILIPKPILFSLFALWIVVAWSVLDGFRFHHTTQNILQDAILFCFLFLLFPCIEFTEEKNKLLLMFTKVWIIGSTFFSLLTFFIYSSGIGHLSDTYYHWFRNIAAGKITDLGNNFFRIVLPEHILLVPIILMLAAYLMPNPKNKKLWGWVISCLCLLVLNFTRIYFLALLVGLLLLAIRQPLKRWLLVSTTIVASILVLFSSIHLIASHGQSLGLELIGVRISGSVVPQTDTSGAIRLAMLPDIFHTIHRHPWFGSGLGATVQYTDPVTRELVIRTQFDWGYFEMIAELGIIGTLIFIFFILQLVYFMVQNIRSSNKIDETSFDRGLLAGLLALCVINITTPALFQGFGILYIVFTLNHISGIFVHINSVSNTR